MSPSLYCTCSDQPFILSRTWRWFRFSYLRGVRVFSLDFCGLNFCFSCAAYPVYWAWDGISGHGLALFLKQKYSLIFFAFWVLDLFGFYFS